MNKLNERSKSLRRELYKLSKANGGYHYGGTFSCAEILISLYDNILTANDRFILSKGHACWGYYVLLRERGFNPALGGHPHLDVANGVYFTTGSEGHGFPAAVGMAFAKKKLNKEGRVFVLIGDGECQEGTTWESLLLGGFHKLNNLTVIVDYNKIQGSGFVNNILPISAIKSAALASNWCVSEIDGHDNDKLYQTLSLCTSQPHLIIADTIKGKGVDFMEGQPKWHSNWPNALQEEEIFKQLL